MDFHQELIAEFDREVSLTRKLLVAIPATADFAFKPQPKSMSLGRLAGHLIESTGEWATGTLTQDKVEFPPDHKFEGYIPANTEAALAAFDPARWESNWQFGAMGQVWINDTKYRVFRTWVLNHIAHHRGQLSVYLRLLGATVPGVYGPSGDEM